MDAVMSETRWPQSIRGADVKTLAVAMTWARATLPSGERTWKRIIAFAGWPPNHTGWWKFKSAVGEDAPRYEPPSEVSWGRRACEAPMIRRDGECGQNATWHTRVTDPVTGRWRLGAWCGRHRAFYEETSRVERLRRDAGTFPEPAPNTGGLLALLLPSPRWPDLYSWARYKWVPPALGLNPNHWPVLEEVHRYLPPTLKAIDGGGEEPGTLAVPPALRLVGAGGGWPGDA